MAASPPEKPEVEQPQSGDEGDDMNRVGDDAQGGGLGDFEVKEQDRWLPIANGRCIPPPFALLCRLPRKSYASVTACATAACAADAERMPQQ